MENKSTTCIQLQMFPSLTTSWTQNSLEPDCVRNHRVDLESANFVLRLLASCSLLLQQASTDVCKELWGIKCFLAVSSVWVCCVCVSVCFSSYFSYLDSSSCVNQRPLFLCVVPARKDMFNVEGRQEVEGDGLWGLGNKELCFQNSSLPLMTKYIHTHTHVYIRTYIFIIIHTP